MMQSISTGKRLFLFVCVLALVICCCAAQSEKSVPDMGCIRSSGLAFQKPHVCVKLPAFLDDEGFSDSDDDSLLSERVHSRRMRVDGSQFLWLLLFCLPAGLSALFAYASAEIFHGSACPTRGLSRTITYMFHSDGQKRRLFS